MSQGGATTQFAVYLNGKSLIGMAEVKLPTIKKMQIELNGAGLIGPIKLTSPSQIEAMETEFKFNSLSEHGFNLWQQSSGFLELKAYIVEVDGSTQIMDEKGYRVILKGSCNEFDLGTIKPAELVNPTIKYDTTALEIFREGKSLLKIDKLAGIFEQFGVSLIKNLLNIN